VVLGTGLNRSGKPTTTGVRTPVHAARYTDYAIPTTYNDKYCLLSGTHIGIYNWQLTVAYATF